jgi:hypothetical protein
MRSVIHEEMRVTRMQKLQLCLVVVFSTLAFVFPVAAQQNLQYRAMAPCRVVDSRTAGTQAGYAFPGTPLPNPGPYNLRIQGNCGIPNGAVAVSLNATITAPSAFGDFRITPLGAPGGTSVLAFAAQQTIANGNIARLTAVSLPADKDLTISYAMGSPGALHFILDVNGYFVPVP